MPECLSLRTLYELKGVSRPLLLAIKIRVVPRTAKLFSTEIDFTFICEPNVFEAFNSQFLKRLSHGYQRA